MKKLVSTFSNQDKLPIQVSFKQRSELICFLYVMGKKLGTLTLGKLMFVNLI